MWRVAVPVKGTAGCTCSRVKYFMELLFQVTGEMERAQVSRVVPELSV